MTVYTDNAGAYYQPGNTDPVQTSMQAVAVRSKAGYQGVLMPIADVEADIASGWTVAPNLTDIGGGVWDDDGNLVDPS